MLFPNNAQPVPLAMSTRLQIGSWSWWNLWKTALRPYDVIQDGSLVVMVDSWPGGSRMSWLGRAEQVLCEPYVSKDEAILRVRRHLDLTKREVLADPCTAAKDEGPGYLLAWLAQPVRRIDLRLPPGLRFRPNGWLEVTDHDLLQSWGLPDRLGVTRRSANSVFETGVQDAVGGQRGGQRRLDQASKRAVELRAVEVATEWCHRQGWTEVSDVGATKAWDLEARQPGGGPPWFVEVKGTTGSALSVIVTEGEVKAAAAHGDRAVMLIVRDITLTLDVDGVPGASDGTLKTFKPWKPTSAELSNTQYVWKPALPSA